MATPLSSVRRSARILVSGGGTAGHVFPVIAVVEALREHFPSDHQPAFLFVGRRASPESALAVAAGIRYAGITAGKLRRYVDLQNLIDPFRVMLGFFQSLLILLSFRPDVVFTKGGFVSVPVVLAARLLRCPIVAHETDAVIGLSNRIAARFAFRLCTAFPADQYRHQLLARRAVATGNPVQAAYFTIRRRTKATPPYTLLIVGSSQGSTPINTAVSSLIRTPLGRLTIFHVTGPAHYERFKPFASASYHPTAYSDHLVDLVDRADLVISRAGGTIFELAAAGRPTVLIPLSSSANRHQEFNAAVFRSKRAAVVIEESELTPGHLRATVERLLAQPAERHALSTAIRRLAVPNAADQVAGEIIQAIASSD
jgi:UDP-N-acetylglucosamine--N-acetylmuramyl-(pentapeptide) pyrophosphoryl-undecaprenol N-acetylglucosamine transferase